MGLYMSESGVTKEAEKSIEAGLVAYKKKSKTQADREVKVKEADRRSRGHTQEEDDLHFDKKRINSLKKMMSAFFLDNESERLKAWKLDEDEDEDEDDPNLIRYQNNLGQKMTLEVGKKGAFVKFTGTALETIAKAANAYYEHEEGKVRFEVEADSVEDARNFLLGLKEGGFDISQIRAIKGAGGNLLIQPENIDNFISKLIKNAAPSEPEKHDEPPKPKKRPPTPSSSA